MKKLCIGIILMCSTAFSQGSILVQVEKNLQAIADEAYYIFETESTFSLKNNKTPVFILPTGSTPLLLYSKIVSAFFENKLDLSQTIFFNMDEYVGILPSDPKSYWAFMDQQLYQFILPGLNHAKLKFFGLHQLDKEHCSNSKLRERLNRTLESFCSELIDLSLQEEDLLHEFDFFIQKLKKSNKSFKLLESHYMNDQILPSISTLQRWIKRDLALKSKAPLPKNIHRLNGGSSDLDQEALNYAQKLEFYQKDPLFQVTCFTGIGANPAHIAFNDLTEEVFKNETLSEKEKNGIALQTQTRSALLSEGTRTQNARFFEGDLLKVPDHALTIGFKEILGCDHIIVLASGGHKKNALLQTFMNSPSYKTPASLLRFNSKSKITFILDEASFGVGQSDSLFSLVIHKSPELQAVKFIEKENSNTSFWDLPEKNRVALIYKEQNKMDPKICYAKLPHNCKVLWVKKGKLHYSLWRRMKEQNNSIKIVEAKEGQDLVRELQNYEPDIIFLPYEQTFVHLREKYTAFLREKFPNKAILGLYYDVEASYCNVQLPLRKKELQIKIEALKKFHLSQNKRSHFDLIINENGKAFDPLFHFMESFTFSTFLKEEDKFVPFANQTYIVKRSRKNTKYKNHFTFTFEKNDLVLAIAPHPDDVEIGMGALVNHLGREEVPLVIANATSGNRSLIKKRDVLKHHHLSSELLSKIESIDSEFIEDKIMKGLMREIESKKAISFLNPHAVFCQLNLPFYENQEVGEEDRSRIDTFLEQYIQNPNRLIVFLPHPIDQHKTHRQTHLLFKERIILFSKKHPQIPIVLAYYITPWTGFWNLYDYSKSSGTRLAALIGAEQLAGNGQESFTFDLLGGNLARRYRLFYFR
jgi:6-phosphogluconolactonase/glucosamine-6-phosphate isomerase/deaminase/LmbE family N-acetylglucosaminyl deacetylase